MDPLERIRSRIPDFAGYDSAPARRLADEQIRALAGERLADIRDAGTVSGSQIEALLFRAEFANQPAFRGFDEIAEPGRIAAVAQADAALLEAAEAADLAAMQRAFDERDAAMRR